MNARIIGLGIMLQWIGGTIFGLIKVLLILSVIIVLIS